MPETPTEDSNPGLHLSKPSKQDRINFIITKIAKLGLVLITFGVYLMVVPVFGLFMFPVYVYRGIVILLQKILHPDWICIMNSRDALVGLDDTTQRCDCMIIASVVFRGRPDLQKIREHFEENVMKVKNSSGELWYKKLTYYYENWMGFPFWKRESTFSVADHVRMFDYKIRKTTVADRITGVVVETVSEEDLLQCCGEIEKLPFAQGQSPWEILILPNFIPRDKISPKVLVTRPGLTISGNGRDENDNSRSEETEFFTLLYRVHHALGDGYSFLKMLMCNVCNEPLESVPKAPTRHHNFFAKLVQTTAIVVFTPYFHFKQFFLEIDTSLWHLPFSKLSKQSHFVSTPRIPMETLKQVGKQHKVPLTGVLLAGLAGGIHNFLKLTGKGHNLPDFMRALSPMPWKEHPAYHGDGMTNHWTVGVFTIPVGESSPFHRLQSCKKSMTDLIKSPILITNFLTIPLLLSAPNFLTDIWGTNWMTSMILSNFPGPKQSCRSFGQYPLDNIITFVPHMRGSAGLGVMFPTVMGNVRCTISIDKAILPDYADAQLLINMIEEEFKYLKALTNPFADVF